MTCEVSIMNRHAVALAADSAVTVTRWVDGFEETRSFKGANKIFQLSTEQPIGLMIFDTASLHEVPWEVIIKDFRSTIGASRLGELKNYAEELFRFVSRHYHLFPRDYQIKLFKSEANKVGISYYRMIVREAAFTEADADQKAAAMTQALVRHIEIVKARPLREEFSQAFMDDVRAQFGEEIGVELVNLVQEIYPGIAMAPDAWADLAIYSLFKNPDYFMPATGMVFAGYGDDDYYPSFHEYQCYGFLLGTLVRHAKRFERVSIDNPADITAFATNQTVTAFMFGTSDATLNFAKQKCEEALNGLKQFLDTQPFGMPANLGDEIKSKAAAFRQNMIDEAYRVNYWPLIRVIASLSIEEMASLGETLIMIESLKEKVTQPTESVSGPIDVAVISKADGFIWIKRKHYFDPALNPRFVSRIARHLGGVHHE